MKTGIIPVRAAALTAAVMGLILTGCTSTRSPKPSFSGRAFTAPMPVASLIAEPAAHVNNEVTISGCVASLALNEIEPDLHVLTLELAQDSPPAPTEPQPVTATVLDFETPLEFAGESLQLAAESPHEGFDQLAVQAMSYKLRASASRMSALSQYLRAKRFDALGKATASVAGAYTEIGNAYAVMSSLPGRHESERVLQSSGLGPQQFESHLLNAAESLNALAESLINARDAMLARELLASGEFNDPEAAHMLLAFGNMMESQGWEERANGALGVADEFQQMGAAFSLLGNGLAGMSDGLASMRDSFELREPAPVVAEFAKGPTLRCAYVGYNTRILEDVRRKVEQLGADTPVTVLGRVHRGSFREEMDTLWLHLDAVQIDGITIDVSFDDESESVRKFQDMVAWIGDLDD